MYKDHQPIVLDKFNGYWNRNDPDCTPLDHFQDCNNISYIGLDSFKTRDGISPSQSVEVPILNVKRIYNYPTLYDNTLLILSYTGGVGYIYHVINSTTMYGPVLVVPGMSDFAFVPYGGRAYISPFTSFPFGDLYVEKGLSDEYIYVYKGDGSQARKAAGEALTGSLTIANGATGHTDAGFHLFAFVAETDTGYLTPPGAITSFTTVPASSVSFGNVPQGMLTTITRGSFNFNNTILYDDCISDSLLFNPMINPELAIFDEDIDLSEDNSYNSINLLYRKEQIGSPNIVARHLVATKKITDYNGNPEGYTFYFVPNAIISNNNELALNDISFYDQDLIDDASHLFDNYSELPAVASLSLYKNRLIACSTYDDFNFALASHLGEPEAISQIEGLLPVPSDGNPITNSAELRDVLYIMKRAKTGSFIDNGEEPVTWPYVLVDTGLGCPVHGIATVLDSGSANVDYLLVTTYQGVALFNGRYILPELSWKIEGYWTGLTRTDFRLIQIVNAPIRKELYITLPNGDMLVGNYANSLDPMKMRWSPVSFEMGVNSVAIWNINDIIIGADVD